MNIVVEKENEIVKLKYNNGQEDISEKLDFSAIEKLIDFIMEKEVSDVTVPDNKDCMQYVELIRSIVSKIKSEDFKKCYKESVEAKNALTIGDNNASN